MAEHLPNAASDYPLLRAGLVGNILATLLLVGVGFLCFPLVEAAPALYLAQARFVAGMARTMRLAGIYATWPGTATSALALRGAEWLSLALGFVWIGYILVSHLLVRLPNKRPAADR